LEFRHKFTPSAAFDSTVLHILSIFVIIRALGMLSLLSPLNHVLRVLHLERVIYKLISKQLSPVYQ
jgi:hypothetical protein